ncbi:unnamed protein product [Microthlaspi erraticum]|uniref:Uncharacterized protein n=1 Tax=Microthlaspi erraticum TaxID=1685480 RepID=A0A6D2IFJ5_9BRAS|nr:unnamed protein product [Microthlaspi erraticum]
MGIRGTSWVLYILFIFHIQHKFPSVRSQPSSVATNHETLPFSASKPEVVWSEVKARELAVVIRRGGGGGGRGGGGGSRGGGGRSRSSGVGRVVPIHGGGGRPGGSHRSSGSKNFRGAMCAVGWLSLSVLASLLLV